MDKSLNLQSAASILGYKEKGLRKIVDRSRRKARGENVHGPTIKFYQSTRGAQILFRPEWLQEFIDTHTCDPDKTLPPARTAKHKSTLAPRF